MYRTAKRLISLCLAALLLFGLSITSGTALAAQDSPPGDINGDGKVNNKDLTRLAQILAGKDMAYQEGYLDVNGDGKFNNKDLTRLAQALAGKDVELFCDENKRFTVTLPDTRVERYDTSVAITPTVEGGVGPFSYQWQQSDDTINWVNMSTSDILWIYAGSHPNDPPPWLGGGSSENRTAHTCYYRVIVQDHNGSISISNVLILISVSPLKATIPASINVETESIATIHSDVSGGKEPYTYTWQYNIDGSNWVTGATTEDYSYIPSVSSTPQYVRLIVKDSCDQTVTSTICVINVSLT